MSKIELKKPFNYIAALAVFAVLAAVACYFLVPRYDLVIGAVKIDQESTENGTKYIKATLDIDCGVTLTGGHLNCKQEAISGGYESNQDVSVVAGDKAAQFQAEDGKFSFMPTLVSLKAVVIRPEPVKAPISNEYKIIMHNKSDNREVIVYTLTVRTNFTDSDLKVINKDPTAGEIKNAIEATSTVKGVCIANEDNDPNGKLGKPGAYYIKIVFADTRAPVVGEVYDEVSSTSRPPKDECEAGNDAGGSIEVFKTKEDAEKRGAHLEAFAGGLFDSGTSTVVNKTVIRTSSELKASQQKQLESNLLKALTE